MQLLEKGFQMEAGWASGLDPAAVTPELRQFVEAGGYSRPGSSAKKEIVQTLELLYNDPVRNFYKGAVSRRLVADTQGHLSAGDLGGYTVVERAGLVGEVGGHQVITSPAPSAGPELLALLRTMETLVTGTNSSAGGFETSAYLAQLTSAMEAVHRQQRLLGDPASDLGDGEQLPDTAARARLLASKQNVAAVLAGGGEADTGGAAPATDWLQAGTQVAVMDAKDVYVSLVLSLGGSLGSGQFSSGFLLNNALAGFDRGVLGPGVGPGRGGNTFREAARPLYRGAPVVTTNTEVGSNEYYLVPQYNHVQAVC